MDTKTWLGVLGFGAVAWQVIQKIREDDLTGEVALITGGSRGLGLLLAREFGQQGCKIAITARDDLELEEAKLALEQQGIEVFAYPCDVGDVGQVQNLIEAVNRHYGRIDILVNDAGQIQVAPLQLLKLNDFRRMMDVMFWGLVNTTLVVLPQMLERKHGRIVNITSIGGKMVVPHLLTYCCAKFAATAFSEGLYTELLKEGIVVTTIVPGLMRTGSYVQAQVRGQHQKEFAWFSIGDNLPILSMDAERAARIVVTATKRREAERVLNFPAFLGSRMYGLVPGIMVNLFALVDRWFLPGPNGSASTLRGMEIQNYLPESLSNIVKMMGDEYAQRFHQYPATLPDIE